MRKITLLAVSDFTASSGPSFSAGETIAIIDSDLEPGELVSVIGNKALALAEVDGLPQAAKPPATAPVVAPPSQDDTSGSAKDRDLSSVEELDAELVELLAAHDPPITTQRQAEAYLAENRGHFRGVTGVGKSGDGKIKAALGLS